MDIENMHPFCLPFGFCHDATSSSIAADFAPVHNNNNNNNDSLSSSITSNDHNNKDKIRSKTSSPSDELFRHLNNATSSASSQSLLNDDLIIGSSSSLDINGDESFYSALELDINIDTNTSHETGTDVSGFTTTTASSNNNNNTTTTNNNNHDETDPTVDDIKVGGGQDDWYCNQYSLFSPTGAHPARRKSLVSRTSAAALMTGTNNQVFQHVVDPIDIKSSPTLAQLNLNSNDDPTDGLWDTTATTASANTDLLSNCTSINHGPNAHHHHGTHNNNNVTCNHLHHHHHLTSPYAVHHLSNVSSPSCHHIHHHHQNNSSSSCNSGTRYSSNSINSTQSTCLAVTPFRKPDLHQYSPRCHNLLTTTSTSSNLNNGPNLKPSATLNQLNQLGHSINSSSSTGLLSTSSASSPSSSLRQLATIDKHNQKLNQQRSASPALVTSSSSPLSSTLNAASENKLIDNKLKENIEYLTALLCNGNKLDSINQQPTISSTMVRSYATLAHSLSTGPKLLERQQQQISLALNAQQNKTTNQQHPPINTCNPTNEAAPNCVDSLRHHQQQHHHNTTKQNQSSPAQQNTLKRPYSDQWFKLAVESSVSAADSTESQLSSQVVTNSDKVHQCPAKLSPFSNQQQQQQQVVSQNSLTTTIDQRQRAPELKVLSSLLSSNKCAINNLISTGNHAAHHGFAGWQDNNRPADCNNPSQAPIQPTIESTQVPSVPSLPEKSSLQQQQQLSNQDSTTTTTSIPPNRKQITLTPIANQNNLSIQQQAGPKSRGSLFAQPASPSASSTASSGGNTDIGPASTASPVKRQRGGNNNHLQSSNQKGNSSGSNRSARPNSMSTDCSLSSHDEGFSSQIDNDECGSTRDSDDDEDVDSDDESFYGDYTNSDLIGATISDNAENKWTLNMGRTRRNGQKRYFWQYNVQSKGPKGARICPTDDSEDPFVLAEASDPVFSNDCQVEGVKHSGKARRGDGNDLTPNPRKLLMIGLELKKLGKIINDLAPVTDLPVNARNKTRKEKNKLASRACRLKKKAQHEANKIKLYGLQREHQQVVLAIYDIRKLLNATLLERETKGLEGNQQQQQQTTIEQLSGGEQLTTNDNENVNSSVNTIAEQCSMKVAGQTSDYVNSVLEKVVSGCIDGGLQT